jgi:hypothetical protein
MNVMQKGKIGAVYFDARTDLEDLAEEMREAYDNTPESLQNSGVGERRGEVADELENLPSEEDVPEDLQEVEIEYPVLVKNKKSRSNRRDDAVSALQAIIEKIDGENLKSDHESFRDHVQELIDGAEAVDFPVMY